jgi:hypothetical protein
MDKCHKIRSTILIDSEIYGLVKKRAEDLKITVKKYVEETLSDEIELSKLVKND